MGRQASHLQSFLLEQSCRAPRSSSDVVSAVQCCNLSYKQCESWPTSQSASRRLPQHTTLVLAGFFSFRSKALRRTPPGLCTSAA